MCVPFDPAIPFWDCIPKKYSWICISKKLLRMIFINVKIHKIRN